MNDIISDIVTAQVKRINDEKERLLTERLKDLGIEIDLKTELQRMFPRIIVRHSLYDKSEAYFWNDETEFGKEIITFYYPENINPFETPSNGIIKFESILKYK